MHGHVQVFELSGELDDGCGSKALSVENDACSFPLDCVQGTVTIEIERVANQIERYVALLVLHGFDVDPGHLQTSQPGGQPANTHLLVVPGVTASKEAQNESFVAVDGSRHREVIVPLPSVAAGPEQAEQHQMREQRPVHRLMHNRRSTAT